MGQLAKIRRLYHREHKSIRSIAKSMGLSRNTVRFWLRQEDDVKQPKYKSSSRPSQIDAYKVILDGWLKSNQHRNKREHRTTLAMYHELKLKGFQGSLSIVYRYVRQWKDLQTQGLKNARMPLWFVHGEAAQFDWSTEYAWVDGSQRKFKLAHMKLCSSRAFYLSAYPSEEHEMLFDAHYRAFAAFGGVPKRIIYDNMKTAVDKVLPKKGRVVNSRFEVMCSHYLFDPDFCNVAAGWEKGIVEKNVQDTRARMGQHIREYKWHSWVELNDWLHEQCIQHWQTLKHPHWSDLPISDVLEDEGAHLMPTPRAFDGYTYKGTQVSSTGLVRYCNNHYSVPIELAFQPVSLHIYPHRIAVVHNQVECASHERIYGRGQVKYDWLHYIPLVDIRPGTLRNGAPLLEMPEALCRLQAHLLKREGGNRLMADVLAMIPAHGLDEVLVAVELAFEAGAPSTEHIVNIISRLKPMPSSDNVLDAPELKLPALANVERYGRLMEGSI